MSWRTPGPWMSEPCYRSGYTVWGGTNGVPVCVVDTQDHEGRFGAIKNEADARMIAAAPCLLEALKRVVSFWDTLSFDGSAINDIHANARAAIAKATGGQP